MLVKALESFAGKVTMYTGEIKEIEDEEILKDLLNAGYIEEIKVEEAEVVEPKPEVVEEPKTEEPEAAEAGKDTKKKK